MFVKKIVCAACAAVTAFSCMAVSAFAEAQEKKEIPFTYDATLVTEEKDIPAVSFDGDDWVKYVHTTPDSSKIGLEVTIDKTTFYQGFSMIANASGSQKDELYLNAGMARDADNNPLFPEASEENAKFICPGIELRCEDFGLSCFDGCFFSFNYKMGADTKDKLMADTVFVFGTDSEYKSNYGLISLKYDELLSNNVTQYKVEGLTVPAGSACTKLVFETPVLENISSDVFCLDNIKIQLPEQDGKTLFIKSLDGYNATAKPQETIEALQIQEKKESRAEIGSTIEKQEGGNGFIVVIIIVVAVIAGGVGGFFFFKKKKRYY